MGQSSAERARIALGQPIFRSIVKALTDAQIKALPTTGIDVVAAPGAGYLHLFHSALVIIDAAAGVYATFSAAGSVHIIQGTKVVSTLVDENANGGVTALLGAAAINAAHLHAKSAPFFALAEGTPNTISAVKNYAIVETLSDLVNKALTIKATNSGGAYTSGNAANSGLVRVNYITVASTGLV